MYLSHTGHSVRDNSPLPPSVLVAELIDLLQAGIAGHHASADALRAARAQFRVVHPLQAFSPEAFRIDGDLRLRSHDAELADALHARRAAMPSAAPKPIDAADEASIDDDDDSTSALAAPAPFFAPPLPAPAAQWRRPTLAQLIEFFRNPARYLLRRRLGVALPREAEELIDDEPFVPDAVARRALARRLLPPVLRGIDTAALFALARAGTEMPAGALGERELQRELTALQQFRRACARSQCCQPAAAAHAGA